MVLSLTLVLLIRNKQTKKHPERAGTVPRTTVSPRCVDLSTLTFITERFETISDCEVPCPDRQTQRLLLYVLNSGTDRHNDFYFMSLTVGESFGTRITTSPSNPSEIV